MGSSLPIVIDVFDIPERIQKLIPVVSEIVNEGQILVTDVNVIKYGKEGFSTPD